MYSQALISNVDASRARLHWDLDLPGWTQPDLVWPCSLQGTFCCSHLCAQQLAHPQPPVVCGCWLVEFFCWLCPFFSALPGSVLPLLVLWLSAFLKKPQWLRPNPSCGFAMLPPPKAMSRSVHYMCMPPPQHVVLHHIIKAIVAIIDTP